MKKHIFISAVMTLAFVSAPAQKMTLRDCMEYAVENSTKIKIRQAENRNDQINRREAILSAFSPSISSDVYAYYNFGRSINPETNTYFSTTSFTNGYSVSAGMYIFNGFKAIDNIKITSTAKLMGINEEQQLKDIICLATMEAFYNVVYYSELTDILNSQVKTAQKSLELVKNQNRLGQKGYADIIQTEAELADRQYQAITVQNELNDAYITLKDIMFWPIQDSLAIDFDVDNATPIYSHTDNPDDIMETAKNTLPSMLIAEGAMRNAKLELHSAKWSRLPSLTFNCGWSSSYYTYTDMPGYHTIPFDEQFKNNSGEYIQLSLSIPIFDRFSRHHEVMRKKNAYAIAEAQYSQRTREVEAEVLRAVSDRDGASAAMIQALHRESVQEQAFQLNTKRHEQGLISSIEYQTAVDNYLNAKAERLYAVLMLITKQKVVNYYKGVSYLEQE